MKQKVIFMVDMESFYASIEKAKIINNSGRPLVVSGDPERRSGVILAACPIAKKHGVKNGERMWEAKQKCPELIVVKPHMQDYIDVSIQITEILEQYTNLVEPYSIDEQFMDVTGSQKLFGEPYEIAKKIQDHIRLETSVHARIGIGENKVLAKMACDNFSKKNKSGIFWLKKDTLSETLWLLPVEKMFGIGSKMSAHLRNMGIRTIGQLADLPLERFKKKWGINGQVLWMTAHGEDYSPVNTTSHEGSKAIGHGMTLPRDYSTLDDIHVVLLELCEEVCMRARKSNVVGKTISVSVNGASFEVKTGFHRQTTLFEPTNYVMDVFHASHKLFTQFWDGQPIRRVGISLSNLSPDHELQLSLFDTERDKKLDLGYVMDKIREKYGVTSLVRASSLTKASQMVERSKKIGGHYK
ncbi:DNA polymerase IV [Halalkalibacter nanhaiisediminis]|uniref:DNA polymerase IV n=1 Tax=Halalkalibacter nanhaiisediminis TaxID=688079 RepID=A0A562QIP2_9BACI|nr:DNA polymerase IV [Halalkalibacter nanhaiisediminis]TWI55916.1 DNA polymerase-4 [Halalkalibacter nanhaiisediminis]